METQSLCLNQQQFNLKSPKLEADLMQAFPELWARPMIDFLLKWGNNSNEIELQTSGSTGKAKRILVSKQKMLVSAQKTCAFFGLSEQSIGLLCMSAAYVGGQMMLVRAIVSGMQLHVIEPTGNPALKIKGTIDFAAMVPLQAQQACNHVAFKHIKHLIIGGGKVSAELQLQIQKTGVRAYETYGMTETLSHVALRQFSPEWNQYFQAIPGISFATDMRSCLSISYP